MWIHKLQTAKNENRLAIPRTLAHSTGFRPGAFIAIEYVDDRTLTLRLLGRNAGEAAKNLQYLVRPHRRPGPPAPG